MRTHVLWRLALVTVIIATVFVATSVDRGLATEKGREDDAAAIRAKLDPDMRELADEVGDKGWIAYSAKTSAGDWDLFVMRPDGSERRNLTNTPDVSEAAPRFSPDGRRMLYRRIKKGATISHDRWGFQGRLVIANADGSQSVVYGKDREFPWAAWNPDGTKISCLSIRGIQIYDVATKRVLNTLDRKSFFQQLFWSPDGKWFCGTANVGGENWTIVRMDTATGQTNVVSKFRNCTPDWLPDSRQIVFSNREAKQKGYGWTQLWMADAAGKHRRLIYGEDGRHIYGGALSPDGKYVLFTRCPEDGGGSERGGAPGGLMRLRDAPTIGGESKALRKAHPSTKDGPVLPLPDGWEPHWTFAEIDFSK